MKNGTLTIRLGQELQALLRKASRSSGKSRSEVAREALRRQLRLLELEALRQRIAPFAEAGGYLLDEDIFRGVS